MENEIVNRVAKSNLITLDLAQFRPKGERLALDIAPWLYEGLLLKEKSFREALANVDWSLYDQKYVSLYCSTDALLPSWAYLLIRTKLTKAALVEVGSEQDLEKAIFSNVFAQIDWSKYNDAKVIVTGCSDYAIPDSVYADLVGRLLPYASSIMFGEACSTVPLYKKPK